ncbi:MAG: VCBS repeat-containing protein [Saprospiraceae bacterium]
MSEKDNIGSQSGTSGSDDNATLKTRKRFDKRVLLLLLLLAAIGYLVWNFMGKDGKSRSPEYLYHSIEETLTAKNPLLQLLEGSETGIDFQNQIVETMANNHATNINIYNGGGVTVADVNNDKLPDIYFVCTNGQNRLYLNEGNFKFKDITLSAGLASEEGFETSVAAVDINNDGFLDLYVCRAGPFEGDERGNKLYINNGISPSGGGKGELTFTERAKEYGLDDVSASTGAAFFDGDGDGDLDLYLLNHPKDIKFSNKFVATPGPDGKPTLDMKPKDPYDSDRYYRNDSPPNGGAGGGRAGSKKFTEVSEEVGIWNRAFGLSVSISDFNRDGKPDVYVGNDFFQSDLLYINSGKGTFTNRLSEYFRHTAQATMGTDLSDFDNDGLIDLFAVDMMPPNNARHKTVRTFNSNSFHVLLKQSDLFEPVTRNVLQRNNGNGTFSDIACQAGVFRTDWSWSGLVADWDNDGLRDIYVTNGFRRDFINIDYSEFTKQLGERAITKEVLSQYKTLQEFLDKAPSFKARDFIFRNSGTWKFEDKGGDWATMKASWSCGAAWADLDLDGDLDLVVNNLEDPAFVFKNLSREQNKGNYLQAKLQGSPINPFAVGASVLIEYNNGQRQYQELNPNRGIFSTSEHLIHFGLGNISSVDKLSVRWPDGKTQVLTNVPANQRLELDWKNASGYVAHLIPPYSGPTYVAERTAALGVNFVHQENRYNDFEAFPLNIWMLSELGPLIAKGDVNGDGLDDFYVGNAVSMPAALYIQSANGRFNLSNQQLLEKEKVFEDHGAIFCDLDSDGDQDLLVLSGGAEAPKEIRKRAWQHRIYLNTDGKGNFKKIASNLSAENADPSLRIAAHDYDNDGDEDLFFGGRVVADNWPLPPRSVVLRNDRGSFTDVTASIAKDFERCGMVTDMRWADLDGDKQKELVVVGEWMPVSVFKFVGGKLVNLTTQFGLAKSNGIWNCVAVADLDNDGDLDLTTGNFGLNTRYTASESEPFGCYAKDFDNNGTLDPIVTFFENGKKYPLVQKEVLVKQMPSLKKKFLYATTYATATIEDIWPKKDLDAAVQLFAYDFETCWWENQGGKFVRHSLPFQTQASAIHGIVAEDLNGDGHLDLLMAGNKSGLEVGSGRYDSGNGVFLSGDGKGNFSWVNNLQSGFWAMREARDLVMLKGAGNRRFFLVGNNNSALQIFE